MLIVQKYGGATLADPEKIKSVAKRISTLKKAGTKIVAVVSAMGQTTNQLIALAQQVSPNPPLRELDMLLSVGERTSMSLVSMALNDLGCEAISFTGSQAGILTDQAHVNAMIKDVKAFRVTDALNEGKAVILAGFQGVSPVTKEITTLGRGGSDTTAVAMAAFLNADRCEILKDVASIFSADPKLVPTAKPIRELNYSHLLEMTYWGAKVLHYRSVELAQQKKVKLYVGPASEQLADGTLIQEDIMFETSLALAVNSHSQVFEVSVQEAHQPMAIHTFLNELQINQIGSPQILHGYVTPTANTLLITAPSEILSLIKNKFQAHTKIKITDDSLCSVSLTCTGSTLNDVLLEALKAFQTAQLSPLKFIQSAMSLNFIFKSSEKNQAVQVLHSLIKT